MIGEELIPMEENGYVFQVILLNLEVGWKELNVKRGRNEYKNRL